MFLEQKKKKRIRWRKERRMKSNENFSVSVLKAGTVKLSFFNVDVRGKCRKRKKERKSFFGRRERVIVWSLIWKKPLKIKSDFIRKLFSLDLKKHELNLSRWITHTETFFLLIILSGNDENVTKKKKKKKNFL